MTEANARNSRSLERHLKIHRRQHFVRSGKSGETWWFLDKEVALKFAAGMPMVVYGVGYRQRLPQLTQWELVQGESVDPSFVLMPSTFTQSGRWVRQ